MISESIGKRIVPIVYLLYNTLMPENEVAKRIKAMCAGCPSEMENGECALGAIDATEQISRALKGRCKDSGIYDIKKSGVVPAERIQTSSGWITIPIKVLKS